MTLNMSMLVPDGRDCVLQMGLFDKRLKLRQVFSFAGYDAEEIGRGMVASL
jgi:hypothetical protein